MEIMDLHGKLFFLVSLISCYVNKTVSTEQSLSCLPCTCHHDNQFGGLHVTCTNLDLTSVPSTLPVTTTTLLLNKNPLSHLLEGAFAWLPNLHYLDLSVSKLYEVDANAFNGLQYLQCLILDYNLVLCNYTSIPQYLDSLFNLQVFSMVTYCSHHHNLLRSEYITELLLVNVFPHTLRELHIDCVNYIFSEGFSLLSNLTHLSFSNFNGHGFCFFYQITEVTFQFFKHLKTLNLFGCEIYYIESGSFSSLAELLALDLSFVEQEGLLFFNATTNLPKTINVIQCLYRGHILDKSYLRSIEHISLSELHLDTSVRTHINVDESVHLPKTLEVISLTNFFCLGSASFYNFLVNLQNHTFLKKLDLSGTVFPQEMLNVIDFCIVPIYTEIFVCNNCKWETENLFGNLCSTYGFEKNIRVLIAHDNNIEVLMDTGVYITNIEYIDFTNNKLREINPKFLIKNNSLYHLNLANNNLGRFIGNGGSVTLNERFESLTFIDISSNQISSLPKDVFYSSTLLRLINISGNILQKFDVNLRLFPRLETLDLSNNLLYHLPVSVREDIQYLPNVSVHLHGNPLACSCEGLDFLKWMQRHQAKFENLSYMSCRLSSGVEMSMSHLNYVVHQLEGQCKSNVAEISISVSTVFCVMTAVAGYLVYHNRWKLRYLYHVGRRGYRRRHAQEEEEYNYQYDAFVSYADEDRRFVIDAMIPELEEKSGLKLCIHHRDFLPGEVIASNIVNAIQNSRKTLIVLSPFFLNSTWCEYEYNMARMEGVSRRQEIVLVVLYKQVLMKHLPKDMAVMFKRNCYLEYNDDVFGNEVFWENVAESITTIRPND